MINMNFVVKDDHCVYTYVILLYDNSEYVGGCGLTEIGSRIWIHGLEIFSEYQRLGYATMVLDIAKQIAYDKPLHLHVVQSNIPAQALYEKAHFERVSPNLTKWGEYEMVWYPQNMRG
jgi:RimJ/RimL family protein N-acetyltransferase